MALTYGFYNSLNGDRRYNAEQFGSIFDGVINDGVYMKIGGQMMVKTANNGFQVNIQTGRAWFLHTWTLNDTVYALTLPDPEVLLNKWVAVVLDINKDNAYRRNTFTYVAGTPASNPQYPTLINNATRRQVPLAYVLIRAGRTVLSQSDIRNAVGTSACPYVTGVVQSMNIDNLIAQWQTQWNEWIASVNADFAAKNTQWNSMINADIHQWADLIADKTDEFASFLATQDSRVGNFISASNVTINEMLDDANDQYTALFSNMETRATQYFSDSSTAWDNWFQHYQDELSSSQAAHLQAQIDAISFIYVLDETAFFPNTGVSVVDETAIFTIGNN